MNKLLDNPDQLSQGRFYVKVKQGGDLYFGVLSADNPYFTKSKETIAGELKAEQEGKTQAEKDQIKEKYEAWENAAQSVSVKNENILIAELMSREPVKVGTTDFYQIKDGDGNHCRVKKSDVEGEPFCQHDWRKMGFEIAEGSSDSHGYLTDKKTLKIFDELYEKIPREYQEFSGNYHTQKDFIDRVITNKKYEYYRRRIIGRHPTEWQGEENSEFIKMLELLTRKKDEPEQLSTHLIGVIQRVLEDYPDIQRAKALFNHEEERIKTLSFWKDVPELATKQPYHISPIAFLGNVISNINYYIDDEGYICDAGVVRNTIKHIERSAINLNFKAIVLHRTKTKTAEGAKNTFRAPRNVVGAHFLIDKDGTIEQLVSLYKYANHVGMIRPKCKKDSSCPAGYTTYNKNELYDLEKVRKYPDRYPKNDDSIGIEVVADCLKWRKNDGHYAIWEEATPEQLRSVEKLIKILQKEFNLNDEDLYQHQYIAYKTYGEGMGLYPAADSNNNVDLSVHPPHLRRFND